jgi:hypothetical protein
MSSEEMGDPRQYNQSKEYVEVSKQWNGGATILRFGVRALLARAVPVMTNFSIGLPDCIKRKNAK